ncbi:lamin tail domain-containing protein [Haladaptatus paucihalophilus]|uniref:lamin tail domain-containing protein n=1 Tax=Haladaptatus paucihalophilus TaxID=367189 RepID=UPI001E2E3138|nr:hypothetical protein [Haladaptatus paucihalophilus]
MVDKASHDYLVPSGVTVPPGKTVSFNTESGSNSASKLYWGSRCAVWNNAAKTAQNRAQAEQCAYDVDALGLIDITNESYENPTAHQYTVSTDDVTDELMACTCPHHVHRNAFCKHIAAVETATDDGTHEAFPSEDDNESEPDNCDCAGLGDFPCWPWGIQRGEIKDHHLALRFTTVQHIKYLIQYWTARIERNFLNNTFNGMSK